jgi:hypothetical protein
MKSKMASRLRRLESRVAAKQASLIRFGVLSKVLPSDYVGERHIVIVSRTVDSTGTIEWCNCEERPGPAPAGSDDGLPTTYFSEADMML